jgi:hypothetical protein
MQFVFDVGVRNPLMAHLVALQKYAGIDLPRLGRASATQDRLDASGAPEGLGGQRRPGHAEFLNNAVGLKVSDVAKRSEIEVALRRLAPRIPPHEFGAVVDHAVDSPGLNVALPETAAWLSLVAYVRHTFTDYDELLLEGYDQDSARFFVASEMSTILDSWGVRRRLTSED